LLPIIYEKVVHESVLCKGITKILVSRFTANEFVKVRIMVTFAAFSQNVSTTWKLGSDPSPVNVRWQLFAY
jgi:hypothetical protein